jgi:nucleoid-associated protein YgaU
VAGERITIRTVDGSIAPISPYRDADSAKLTEGWAKYETIDRPKRTGATQFTGRDPYVMTVPVLFDGLQDHNPQEDEIRRLIGMSVPPKDLTTPPSVKVSGGTPGDNHTWKIQGLAFGDNVIWGFVGGVAVRFRQDCVITLLQWVPVDLVTVGRGAGKSKKKVRTYVVKHGDSLGKIAAKECGDRNKWKKIASANGIRDPKAIKVGQKLRITC